MKQNDISEHFTKLDRSILGEHKEYEAYFEHLKKAFSYLIHSFSVRTSDNPIEVNIMHAFIQRFLNTIESLHTKYALEGELALKIDLTDSSFPNFMELKKVTTDVQSRNQLLNAIPAKENLIQSTLDYLFEKEAKPDLLLKQLGRRAYLEQLGQERIFSEFTMGDLIELQSLTNKKNKHYILPWATFDAVVNRPFIYILIFEKAENRPPFEKMVLNEDEFKNELKKLTQNLSPLRVMAYDIDALNEVVRPKTLKRIELGPLFGKYSMDDNPFSKIIKEKFRDDFIFQFTTEIIFSVGEKKSKSFLSSGELRQVFFIDESNKEAMERHVSKVLKYVMAPHHVVQYLKINHADLLKQFSMEPIAVS